MQFSLLATISQSVRRAVARSGGCSAEQHSTTRGTTTSYMFFTVIGTSSFQCVPEIMTKAAVNTPQIRSFE